VTYTYDAAGRMTEVQDTVTGTYTFGYDNMNRLSSAGVDYSFDSAGTLTVQYGYDKASNRTSMTDPQSVPTTYGYDTLNRLHTLTYNGQSPNYTFGYDALSRRNSLTRPNGVATTYGYDPVSRLLSVLHKLGSTTLDGAVYTYDNAGNRLTRVDQCTSTQLNYTNDHIYQLTKVTQGTNTPPIVESYSYDLVGNRLSSLGVSPYNYNSSNELTSTPSGNYTYDANGNTLSDAQGRSFTWDFENRLMQAVVPGTNGGTTIFKYDPFGRRIQKSGPLGTTNYLYDGPNLLEEVDSTGNVLARYTQAWKADEPFAELRSGTTSYYEQDGLSSVSSLSNAAGALANTYTYDSFGKLTASTGSITNPFQYTGREFDSETGIYSYRHRYYDPNIGRFISGDPVGFRGQDINLYRYVKNQPTGFVDPSGLVSIDPNFNPNCLHSLNRALNILHHLPKKCDCAFRAIGTGRSFTDLINDPGITVHSAPNDDVTATGPNGQEGAYTIPGDTHDIWLRPVTCRFGAWMIAQNLVHEMVHITLVPGDNQEDQAYGMEATCGLWPLRTTVGVSTPQTEVPTITSDVPNQIPE
jgi:RHS repeat-associated protein